MKVNGKLIVLNWSSPISPSAVPPVETEKSAVTERFRRIAAEVDPALQLRRVVPLSLYYTNVRSIWRYLAWGVGLVTCLITAVLNRQGQRIKQELRLKKEDGDWKLAGGGE